MNLPMTHAALVLGPLVLAAGFVSSPQTPRAAPAGAKAGHPAARTDAAGDPLPPGARPDLSVDGTITLENLKDVLYVGRPVHGQSDSTIGLFKLTEDGSEATRVNVKLGRSSVNTIEILDGLKVGDKVILSDMSAWDNYDRVQLK